MADGPLHELWQHVVAHHRIVDQETRGLYRSGQLAPVSAVHLPTILQRDTDLTAMAVVHFRLPLATKSG